MKVGLLTTEQKDQLIGQKYHQDSYFYPIQDASDNWVIGKEEIDSNKFDWLKDLPLIDFEPKNTLTE